jgi:hypothetical protein
MFPSLTYLLKFVGMLENGNVGMLMEDFCLFYAGILAGTPIETLLPLFQLSKIPSFHSFYSFVPNRYSVVVL